MINRRPVVRFMAVRLARRVDFPMVDMAGIAFYPRIYDLAHRFFEEFWEEACGIDYPTVLSKHRVGFPVVDIKSTFHAPLRYGDTVNAAIWISAIGNKSCTWQYRFNNQNGELIWSSEQVTACVSMDSMESMTIPDLLRAGLEACGDE